MTAGVEIETLLREILVNNSPVFSAVGVRIRPDVLDEDDDFPAVLIEVEEEDPLAMLSDFGGLQKARVAITSLSRNRIESRQIAKKIRTALDGYDGTVNSVEVEATFEKRENGFEHDDDGADIGVYFCASTFEIWWDETTA